MLIKNPSSRAFAGFIIEWGDASFVEVGDDGVKVLAQVGMMQKTVVEPSSLEVRIAVRLVSALVGRC